LAQSHEAQDFRKFGVNLHDLGIATRVFAFSAPNQVVKNDAAILTGNDVVLAVWE
jgi:hypothetical protein